MTAKSLQEQEAEALAEHLDGERWTKAELADHIRAVHGEPHRYDSEAKADKVSRHRHCHEREAQEPDTGTGPASGEVVPKRTSSEWADLIRADLSRSVQGIIDAGNHLIQAQAQIAPGTWLSWLGTELRMAPRTAQRFMAIARHPVLGNATHASHLPASWYTLYLLSQAPEGKLRAAIESGHIGPGSERADAENWLRQQEQADRQ
jgi:hypothetical protein